MEILGLQVDVRTGTLLIAGLSTVLCLQFSATLMMQHRYHWVKPEQQKQIMIIICMAPLYAVTSFFGLVEVRAGEVFFTILESIKECYEALVIASFLKLMYCYLNVSTSSNAVPDEIKGRLIHHTFPITLFQPHEVKLDQKTLKLLQLWTWQFVVIRPALSVLVVSLEALDMYEGWLSWAITLVLNCSVTLAMYSLITFYHVFAKELAPHNPLAKFICIKGVVFFSFWQGIVLSLLAYSGVIRAEHKFLDLSQVEEAYQNLFVCIEMVFFGMFQMYAFSPKEYYSTQEDVKVDAVKGEQEKKDE
ncbi:hypothetical protein MPTK1_3g08600 [Marchantia polymorpha subsp. ruderalis]|uniref:Uncharacterized protein n=2 Tax=Marchantia polymorpha TaxID=3197 RepID=A0AAF6AYQ9_MARPO|nr:hypothetical protein MARPO_0105s0057 [Marchantia polymorpha]BBN04893.1 hypothetical protein Mp_3g08600 [Marchantia polymorpha subsp. ruderalis]|eukprot:PTQ31951.1 hypothetical protein MARPO_0105s0057 [Marchantia polymorpha]